MIIPSKYEYKRPRALSAINAVDREISVFIEEIFITDFPHFLISFFLPFVVFMYSFATRMRHGDVFNVGRALLSHL